MALGTIWIQINLIGVRLCPLVEMVYEGVDLFLLSPFTIHSFLADLDETTDTINSWLVVTMS